MISNGKAIVSLTLARKCPTLSAEIKQQLADRIDEAIRTADRNARALERQRCHRLVMGTLDEIAHMGLDA